MAWKYRAAAILLMLGVGIIAACQAQPNPVPSTTYTPAQLKYRLISNYSNVFFCDPDYYPVARQGQEETNARDQFPSIRADQAEFSAILEQLGLPDKADYTDQEQLLIYQEHKKLQLAIQMTPSTGAYQFTLRVGQGQGQRIEGNITTSGKITILKTEASFNTCPICLSKSTLIATPSGQIPVDRLLKGMDVWTVDASGKSAAAEIIKTSVTPVPPLFQMVRITLNDGRVVTASSGHPTGAGRALGEYKEGDALDGSQVLSVEHVAYDDGLTYDLLPAGPTGLYRANGILLKSTLNND